MNEQPKKKKAGKRWKRILRRIIVTVLILAILGLGGWYAVDKLRAEYTVTYDTYTATIGGRTISGNYTLNTADKKITMTYLAGIGKMTPHIAKSGSKLSLLIESDKLLTLVKGASALSNSSTMKTVSSLLSSYDGMLVGLQLKK